MAQGTTKGVPIDIDPLLANNSDLLVPSQKAVKTYIDTADSNKVNRSGDTMSGSLLLVSNPTAPLEAATKDYVDTLINGIDWKQSVNASTVASLPTYTVTGSGQILTGTVNGAIPSATTDGVTLTANQRLLVKNETSTLTPNNGIYVVTQVGNGSLPFILTRSSDANTSALLAEATVSVASGSTLSNTQWHCNPATIPLVIGTTDITFAQIGSGTYTFSSPLVNTGGVISIPAATSSVNGYLTSTDWSTFNGKQNALGFTPVPDSRTLTINGTTYDLTANRTWSVGTVTSVTGSDPISSSGGATPDISISQANSTTNGYLSSTDWTTFNNKVNTSRSISTASPLTGGGDLSLDRTLGISNAAADGTTKGAAAFTASDFNDNGSGLISIDYTNGQAASSTNKGFLTSADWTTFNSKSSQDTFVLQFYHGGAFSPADNTTYYFAYSGNAIGTVATSVDMNLGYAFKIVGVQLFIAGNTVSGTNENVTLQVRNVTTSTSSSVGTYQTNLGSATVSINFTFTGLNISIGASDFFCLQVDTPTWAINPVGCNHRAQIICERQ